MTPSSTRWWSCAAKARHARSRSPSTIGFCLSEFTFSISHREVGDSSEKKNEVIVGAI
jgi:hypothetical protein